MKRLHLHVSVADLERSVRFYSTLFGAEPSRREADYAKWALDDPPVNLAISARGRPLGLDHLGLDVDSAAELAEVTARLRAAGETVVDQPAAHCCYARSDKGWAEDPQGVTWETFRTYGDAPNYGDDSLATRGGDSPAACGSGVCCAGNAG